MGEDQKQTKSDEVLQWIQIGMVLLPQVLEVVSHYVAIGKSGALSETDKERMKQNLEKLKLPAWSDI